MSVDEKAFKLAEDRQDITASKQIRNFVEEYEIAKASEQPDELCGFCNQKPCHPKCIQATKSDWQCTRCGSIEWDVTDHDCRACRQREIEIAGGVLKLTKTIRYIQGIVERGENRKLREDECVDIAILNYVKRLEQRPSDVESIQQEYYKRGWKEAQEHYTKRESGDEEEPYVKLTVEELRLLTEKPYWLCCGSIEHRAHLYSCLEERTGHKERCRFGTSEQHFQWQKTQDGAA